MKRKSIIVFVLFFFFLTFFYWYISRIYDFLACGKPVHQDALIVEGWLPEEALDKACAEFHASGYRYIITTGFPYYKGFLMGSMGELRFTIGQPKCCSDTNLIITVTARGTKAYNEYPHFRLYADTAFIGETFTDSKIHDYTFKGSLNFLPGSVIINYDNDTYAAFRDRNLIVQGISVNQKKYNVNASSVAYFKRSKEPGFHCTELNISTADEKAAMLIKKGIPDSLIFAVGSFRKIKSKTYTSGLDVNTWLIQNPEYHVQSINILTLGCHARRSYLSYRKAIQNKSIRIGVISLYDPNISKKNWWKTRKGIKEIIYETIGYLYVQFFI
jgi:Ca-dependent carbohydrate-binding module xylan-binding